MAEDHQLTLTLSDTYCDLCPKQIYNLSNLYQRRWKCIGKEFKTLQKHIKDFAIDSQNWVT